MIQDFKMPEKGSTLEDILDIYAKTNERSSGGNDYMNEYFTKEEAVRHADNINHYFSHEGDVAFLKMMLLSAGFDLDMKPNK